MTRSSILGSGAGPEPYRGQERGPRRDGVVCGPGVNPESHRVLCEPGGPAAFPTAGPKPCPAHAPGGPELAPNTQGMQWVLGERSVGLA